MGFLKVTFKGKPEAKPVEKNTELENANYAQKTYNEKFSTDGQIELSKLTNKEIKTINDLVKAIKNNDVNPKNIPVQYIKTGDGNVIISNTRTSQALEQAGIPRSEWKAVDITNSPKDFDRVMQQLERNKLTLDGTPVVRLSKPN